MSMPANELARRAPGGVCYSRAVGHSRSPRCQVTGDAEIKEIDMLEELSYQIEGHTICALGATPPNASR